MTTRRLVPVLLAVLLIAASGVLYRLSDEPANFQVVRAPVGELVAFGAGYVAIEQIQVGTTLSEGSDSIATSGMFVMARVRVQAPGRTGVTLQQVELVTPDRTYRPYTDFGAITADPGFQAEQEVVFEVDPHHLVDLTVQAYDSSFVVGYHQRVRTHLGITTANTTEWVTAAQHRRLSLQPGTQTAGLR